MKPKRTRRIKRIKQAQHAIEEVMLQFRKEGNPTLEHDKAFGSLYYLVALARKAP